MKQALDLVGGDDKASYDIWCMWHNQETDFERSTHCGKMGTGPTNLEVYA